MDEEGSFVCTLYVCVCIHIPSSILVVYSTYSVVTLHTRLNRPHQNKAQPSPRLASRLPTALPRARTTRSLCCRSADPANPPVRRYRYGAVGTYDVLHTFLEFWSSRVLDLEKVPSYRKELSFHSSPSSHSSPQLP